MSDFKGKSVPLDQQFVSAMNEQASRLSPQHTVSNATEKTGRKYLLIITNENELGFECDFSGSIDHLSG
jgi:hypothetical protein